MTHVTAHTNHIPGPDEDKYLPIPKSTWEDTAVNNGISTERIMEGEFHVQCNKTYSIVITTNH